MWEGSFGCAFDVGHCVQGEWVVRGGGLYGCFEIYGLPVGVQESLEGFHRRSVDYLTRQFVPKCCNPNSESALATAGKTYLLAELIGVAA